MDFLLIPLGLVDLIEQQMGMDHAHALDTVSRATRITVNGEPYEGDPMVIPPIYSGKQFTVYSPDRNVTVNFVEGGAYEWI